MEVASYLNDKAKSITIVGRSKFPFRSNLGEKIGEQFQKVLFYYWLEIKIYFVTDFCFSYTSRKASNFTKSAISLNFLG